MKLITAKQALQQSMSNSGFITTELENIIQCIQNSSKQGYLKCSYTLSKPLKDLQKDQLMSYLWYLGYKADCWYNSTDDEYRLIIEWDVWNVSR